MKMTRMMYIAVIKKKTIDGTVLSHNGEKNFMILDIS